MANPQLDDDEPRLGLPHPSHSATVRPPEPTAVPKDLDPTRGGETGLGLPPQLPVHLLSLSAEDKKKLDEAQAQKVQADSEQADEILASRDTFSIPDFLTHPLTAALFVGTLALLGLFVISHITSTLADLDRLPLYAQYAGYSALIILSLALVYAMGRLLVFYIRLRVNRQLRLAGLTELNRRAHLRYLVVAKATEARELLQTYLRDYPLKLERDCKALQRLGLDEAKQAAMVKVRDELLEPARFTGSEQWFEDFRTRYQALIDLAAQSRVNYWAKRTSLATAISPNALVDAIATTYFSLALLGDLCRLYNLRVGRVSTMVLLSRVFMNAYLAGQLNEFESVTEEAIEGMITPGGVLGELVGAKLAGKLGAKAASAAANYFLLCRLGRHAMMLLRPVVAK